MKQEFGAECHNATYIPITDKLRKFFLNGHNEKRNLVAQGQLDHAFLNKTATRMATLVSNSPMFTSQNGKLKRLSRR